MKLVKGLFLFVSVSTGWVLVSSGCVRRTYNSNPDIVSGALVEEKDPVYLSTVSLNWDGKPNCTGFVLDKRTIVTAAHCLATIPGQVSYSVTFGSNNRSLKETVLVPVKQVMANPGWDRGDLGSKDIDPMPQSPKNDIGVIVLSEDAPEWVKPLPVKEIGDVSPGRDVVIAGYGQTRAMPGDTPMPEFSGFLRKTTVKLAKVNDAGKELMWEAPADNTRASSCHGDSGGPMFYVEDDSKLTVIGVTSRSYSAATDCTKMGIYTDVRKHMAWIRSTKEKLASGVVSTQDWLHRYFETKEGTKIALDFKLISAGVEYLADEVWINVYNPVFSGSEVTSAKLSSYINSLTQQEVSLKFAGEHRFTGKFDKFKGEKVCAIASRWGVKQDVSIQVDGKGLIDPLSGGEAFTFKFCN
ncbi:hypothetical protein EBU99_13060 [bacterium]|nr:hypothetical protein [bacterium]